MGSKGPVPRRQSCPPCVPGSRSPAITRVAGLLLRLRVSPKPCTPHLCKECFKVLSVPRRPHSAGAGLLLHWLARSLWVAWLPMVGCHPLCLEPSRADSAPACPCVSRAHEVPRCKVGLGFRRAYGGRKILRNAVPTPFPLGESYFL